MDAPRTLPLAGALVIIGALSCVPNDDAPPDIPDYPLTGAAGTGSADFTGGAGTTGSAGTTGFAGTGFFGSLAGAGPTGPLAEIEQILTTPGCGVEQPYSQAAGTTLRATIMTSGTKPADAADTTKGDWSYEREYFLSVPAPYDARLAYPLVIEGPPCGGNGSNTYTWAKAGPSIPGKLPVIHVGLTPPPNAIGHATNPNQGCFDDKEGDDSVDWVFYEALYDHLAATLCFDKNRVYVTGMSSGGMMANELACKYAGDPQRPVRGVLTFASGLPAALAATPTCTAKPLAGMWVGSKMDPVQPFENMARAINRAMKVNGCWPAMTYETATLVDFPIASVDAGLCKRVLGCPAVYPIVVCDLPFYSRSSQDQIVNPGFTAFLRNLAPR
jgi:hypothetical protein